MKNYLIDLYWNYINAGKGRFYSEDPRIPFINGFSLILLAVFVPFGIQRFVSEGMDAIIPVAVNFIVAAIVIGNLYVLRRTLRSDRASTVIAFCVVSIAGYVFYEGATGGDTGILWVYPIPTLIFFLSGKKSALVWSAILTVIVLVLVTAHHLGYIPLPYTTTQIGVFLFPLLAIIAGLYVYADFTERNAQELEERTRSLKEGFEAEKRTISVMSKEKEMAVKEELNTFFNTTDELMGIASAAEGRFIELNPAAERILGYSLEEIMAKPFMHFVHPDDVLKTQGVVADLISGKQVANFVNRYLKKDGTYVWLMWNAVCRQDLFYATAQDVSEIMVAQEKMEERIKETEELNRLMVGREVRMAELKEELAKLQKGKTPDGTVHL